MDAGGVPFAWVTVADCADTVAVEPARIRLEAEGIPTFVDGERMGSRSMYQVATGGIRLKVPGHLAGEARIILSQTWSATAAQLGIEEDEEDRDEPVPEASHQGDDRTGVPSVRSSVILLLGVGLLILALLGYLALRGDG
jgi:hypothetical protein